MSDTPRPTLAGRETCISARWSLNHGSFPNLLNSDHTLTPVFPILQASSSSYHPYDFQAPNMDMGSSMSNTTSLIMGNMGMGRADCKSESPLPPGQRLGLRCSIPLSLDALELVYHRRLLPLLLMSRYYQRLVCRLCPRCLLPHHGDRARS